MDLDKQANTSISIHALREEGDLSLDAGADAGRCISIHALREEGDSGLQRYCPECANFYPRPPRGGRQRTYNAIAETIKFLSTPSARRATDTES